MKKWDFQIILSGGGETKEQAWRDACEAFSSDPGAPPDDYLCAESDICPECGEADTLELIKDEKEGRFYICTSCNIDFEVKEIESEKL